jgi:molybdopterin-biosynthesis enzyme MoeA-like protein
VTVTPTGKSQVLDGIKCDEFTFTTKMNMGEVSGRQLPPEARQMMQGVMMVMNGSMWVAKDVPGGAEYLAFQKASAPGALGEAAMTAAGVSVPGMEKLMKAMLSVQGLPYLTEMTINIEGTGQIADMMKQMGAMKVTTRVSSIKTDALSDDLFKVPEGYSVIKQ